LPIHNISLRLLANVVGVEGEGLCVKNKAG